MPRATVAPLITNAAIDAERGGLETGDRARRPASAQGDVGRWRDHVGQGRSLAGLNHLDRYVLCRRLYRPGVWLLPGRDLDHSVGQIALRTPRKQQQPEQAEGPRVCSILQKKKSCAALGRSRSYWPTFEHHPVQSGEQLSGPGKSDNAPKIPAVYCRLCSLGLDWSRVRAEGCRLRRPAPRRSWAPDPPICRSRRRDDGRAKRIRRGSP